MDPKKSCPGDDAYKHEKIYDSSIPEETYSLSSDTSTETSLLDNPRHLESLLYNENVDPDQTHYYPMNLPPPSPRGQKSTFQSRDSGIFPTHFLLQKLDTLKDNIQEVKTQLEARQQNSEAFEKQIDSDIKKIGFLLGELNDHWGLGNSPSIELRRMHLERELNLLRNQKRLTIVNAWKDIVWLKKYLRELVREYHSLVRVRELFE